MKTCCAIVLFFSTFAFGAQKWMSPDFFVERGPRRADAFDVSQAPNKDCRAHIAKVMCLVDPGPDGQMGTDRPCLEGGETYAAHFERLHDVYPAQLQRMFCSLRRIYIEKKFFGTAYAGIDVDDSGKITGAKMGIRQSVLDEALDLRTWASWKEQLSFGGHTDSYTIKPDLPVIKTRTSGALNDFLYFVVAHEFGHIFDFANKLNRFRSKECAQKMFQDHDTECELDEGSWGALSWKTNKTPKPHNEFEHRKGLCFYWCEGKPLSKEVVPSLYADLVNKTEFLSIYTTTQPWDDFADSLAYYLMDRHLGTKYRIDTSKGERHNIMAKLRSPLFSNKYSYIEEFLRRPDIFYP